MDLLSGFSHEEYLTMFIAFIYGHIVSNYFSGWANLIQHSKQVKWSLDYIFFTIICFLQLIDKWWVSYVRVAFITEDVLTFYLSLFSILTLFILSVAMFSGLRKEEDFNLMDFFGRKMKMWAIILGFHFLLNTLASPLLEHEPFLQQENLFRIGGVLLCIPAAFLPKSRRLILVLAGTLLVYHWITLKAREVDLMITKDLSFVEYLMVFTAFVYGYTCSRFFHGWGWAIYNYKRISFSLEHFGWSILAFMLLINIWWSTWLRAVSSAENISYFVLSLIPPMLFYVIAVLLFPRLRDASDVDLKTYFYTNRQKVLWLFVIFFIVNASLSILLEEKALFYSSNLFRIAAIALALIAITLRNVLVNKIILTMALLMMLVYIAFMRM